jgi:hypothetical protein
MGSSTHALGAGIEKLFRYRGFFVGDVRRHFDREQLRDHAALSIA